MPQSHRSGDIEAELARLPDDMCQAAREYILAYLRHLRGRDQAPQDAECAIVPEERAERLLQAA